MQWLKFQHRRGVFRATCTVIVKLHAYSFHGLPASIHEERGEPQKDENAENDYVNVGISSKDSTRTYYNVLPMTGWELLC